MQAKLTRELVDAATAARFLDVQLATLYAYASRGLIRRAPGPNGRSRLYHRADLERLRARHDARAGHGPTAAAALRFGEPVLESAITALDPRAGPLYRGQSAVTLAAAGEPLEAVAEQLWASALDESRWVAAARDADRLGPVYARGLPRIAHVHGRMAALITRAALDDDDRFDAARDAELDRGRRIMHLLVHALVDPHAGARRGRPGARGPKTRGASARVGTTARGHAHVRGHALAPRVATSVGAPQSAEVVRAIDAALVLMADHELNASTFTARVAASTGADLFMCVTAALATLSGPEHGSSPDRLEAMMDEIARPARALAVIRARARRGDGVPGFGHHLYSAGDPRAPPLLELAQALSPRAPRVRVLLALVDAMADAGQPPPAADVGLVAIAEALALPRGSATALFAVGRAAGWIAHALEQRAQGFMLRPRARYVGPRLPG